MKKVLLLGLLISSVFSVEMKVKKADVMVSINTQEFKLKKGDVQNLEEGTTICFLSGKGKVVIPALKKQLKKPKRCLMIPISDSAVQSYASDIKGKLEVAFWDSSESVRGGKGTKGETTFESEGSFVLTQDQNELIVFGKEFGPLPVIVLLKDKDGNEVMSFENEESETTIVRIGRKQLNTGMTVEVYDGFETLLLSKTVIIEEK